MSGMPVIGVLAVQGDVREHVRALESAGAATRAIRRPRELEEIDGLVIPGGESTDSAQGTTPGRCQVFALRVCTHTGLVSA